MDSVAISVIIIDDDSAVRDSLFVLLSFAGFSIIAFESAHDYLAVIENHDPDCLIIDLHMPRIGGIELINALGELGNTVPIIVISGNMDKNNKAQAEQAGASRFLKKPFAGKLLIETIHGLVK